MMRTPTMRLSLLVALLTIGSALGDPVINLGGAPPRYKGVVAVKDADATGGVAYKTTKGVAGVVQFAYSWETMGIYEATFRLKVADNTSAKMVTNFRYNCETTQFKDLPEKRQGHRALKGTDFEKPGVYQDFKVQWLAPRKGRNGWAIYTSGETELWVDSIRVRKVRAVSESELLPYLPNGQMPPEPTPRSGPWRVHLMRGFFSDYFMLDLALPRIPGIRVTSSSWSTHGGCAGQPGTPRALYGYDVLIMAGTDIAHIGISQRIAVKKWVEGGGGLFILGGPRSFAEANMKRSVVGDLLPVTLEDSFDLKRDKVVFAPGLGAGDTAILKGIDLTKPMVALFRHEVKVRPGAAIVLGTAEKPLLVVWQVGKGRVACFLSAPMGRDGEAGPGETVFWDDARLPALFANVVRYLITRPAPADALHWQPDGKPSEEARKLIRRVKSGSLELTRSEPAETTDDGGFGADLDMKPAGGSASTPKLKPAELALLMREGGKPAVPILLQMMPTVTDKETVRSIEWAVRPYIGKAQAETVQQLLKSFHAMIRESAAALMGKANPAFPARELIKQTRTNDPRLLRAVCRAALEGRMRDMIPWLKQTHARLKPEVEKRRLSRYEGYWFNGIPPEDLAWAYAECTMALLAMGEKGYVQDAVDLLFLLHLQDIKIRSFIFLYNPKVPREAKAAERHHLRDAFVRPDMAELLVRFRLVLSTLPEPLHEEFHETVLKIDDFEKMLCVLYSAYDLMATHDTAEWRAFRPELEKRALSLAVSAERF